VLPVPQVLPPPALRQPLAPQVLLLLVPHQHPVVRPHLVQPALPEVQV
jgi:hypothetical protein